jgi:diguanylate cyclase (GGDEF)-like protein
MRILLVEDDELIADTLAKTLADHHYVVDIAVDGKTGWELVEACSYDLILLDVILPKLDGLTFCRRLRAQGHATLVLLLTAADDSTSKVMGLDAGADDYLVKPFNLPELLARIRALLRRRSPHLLPPLTWGHLQLNPNSGEVTWQGDGLKLTPKEYSLLEIFLRNPQRVYSASALIEQLWAFDDEAPTEDTIRSHIKGLRHKLKAIGMADDPLETVYGMGYRLRKAMPPELQPAPAASQKSPKKKSKKASGAAAEAAAIAPGMDIIWQQMVSKLAERVAVLDQALTVLLQGKQSKKLGTVAAQEAHKLVGSLGMFGSDEGSRLARRIERLWKSAKPLTPKQIAELAELVPALKQALQKMSNAFTVPPVEASSEPTQLLLVTADQTFAATLAAQAPAWQLHAQSTADLAQVQAFITATPDDLVGVFDLSTIVLAEAIACLTELRALHCPVPILVLTNQILDLPDRINLIRLGVQIFLPQPIAPSQLLDLVTQARQTSQPANARVLVVDDDEMVLGVIQQWLQPWGLQVFTLNDSRQFLDTLRVVAPDLLILDIEMPHVDGLELCQVIRRDPSWSSLPILIITAHQDADTKWQVFTVGADDYLHKPIVEPELIARVLNRLERSRLLRTLAETDPLTRVVNRRKSTQDLNRLLGLAQRYHQSFCLALLDLDHFKQVNDNYGHAMGDYVLQRLGELLRSAFREEDVVGRWGGEEFVIGLYGSTQTEALHRLRQLLIEWQQQVFMAVDHRQFRVTFSAGVAQYPENGNDLQTLYRSSDAALYRAKAAGRSQILPVV